MAAKATAKLFMHGRSQAVRLPKEFRMPGTEVKVSRVGDGVLLEPVTKEFDFDTWQAKFDALRDPDFMKDGREQPPMPEPDPDELFD